MKPFENETLDKRIAWYEARRLEHLELANEAKKSDDKARHLQQAALAQAIITGLEEAALMVGVCIAPSVMLSLAQAIGIIISLEFAMKTEDVKKFGDIANLRWILASIDKNLEILADPSTLQTMHEKDIDNAFDGLMRARMGTANMLTILGDDIGYRTDPPRSRNKSP